MSWTSVRPHCKDAVLAALEKSIVAENFQYMRVSAIFVELLARHAPTVGFVILDAEDLDDPVMTLVLHYKTLYESLVGLLEMCSAVLTIYSDGTLVVRPASELEREEYQKRLAKRFATIDAERWG